MHSMTGINGYKSIHVTNYDLQHVFSCVSVSHPLKTFNYTSSFSQSHHKLDQVSKMHGSFVKNSSIVGLKYFSKSTLRLGAFNNWFICQHAFIEIWSTREVWRAQKMHKSCLRHSQEQLWLLECSPNFPRGFIPRNMKHTHPIQFD